MNFPPVDLKIIILNENAIKKAGNFVQAGIAVNRFY